MNFNLALEIYSLTASAVLPRFQSEFLFFGESKVFVKWWASSGLLRGSQPHWPSCSSMISKFIRSDLYSRPPIVIQSRLCSTKLYRNINTIEIHFPSKLSTAILSHQSCIALITRTTHRQLLLFLQWRSRVSHPKIKWIIMLRNSIGILIVVYTGIHHTVLTHRCSIYFSCCSIVVIGSGASSHLWLGLVVHGSVQCVAFGLQEDVISVVMVVDAFFVFVWNGWNLLIENAVCHCFLVNVLLRIYLAPFGFCEGFFSSCKVVLSQD